MLEVLVASTLMGVALLSIATMYLTAHASLERSGDASVAAALGRQLIEQVRSVPFATLTELDGLDTTDPTTLPADEPQRSIARRWRYAVAGESDGWSYSDKERVRWASFAAESAVVAGRLEVDPTSASTRTVTVTMSLAGDLPEISYTTLISRTVP